MSLEIEETLDMLFKFWNGEISEEEFSSSLDYEPMYRPHGKCVDVKEDAYHDIYTYEDGYEEYDYIGD